MKELDEEVMEEEKGRSSRMTMGMGKRCERRTEIYLSVRQEFHVEYKTVYMKVYMQRYPQC